MAWMPYMIIAGLVLLGGASFAMLSMVNADPTVMWNGAAAGAVMGIVLMVFGWLTTLKGINSATKKSATAYMVGGFFLRLMILVVGIFVLASSGWGHPAGFAMAFFMAIMLHLGLRTIKAMKDMSANSTNPQAV